MKINISEKEILKKSPNGYGIGGNHYTVLLSHLSTYFNDSVILELGTLYGKSAAALAYNKTNQVYTYDIEHNKEAVVLFGDFDNIEYIIADCIGSKWSGTHIDDGSISDREIILSSKLIFLDTDPHDGIQEKAVSDFLIENNWKGIMVCDDTGFGLEEKKQNSHPAMREWWNSVDVKKYDISDSVYAAGTGTGIMCFGNQEIITK
tara:strand:+ start:56 stop:670 length:615 start_codon:yes stop_codon:yes gene_type:complete